MNREEAKEALELFNKLDIIRKIEKDYALHLKGELNDGDVAKDFDTVLHTPNRCSMSVPYSYLAGAVEEFKTQIVLKLKALGFDGEELASPCSVI